GPSRSQVPRGFASLPARSIREPANPNPVVISNRPCGARSPCATSAPSRMLGERFGSFKAVAKLGAGSMGEVYLAEHQRIDRRAAIKVLAPELTHDPE